MLKNPCTKKVIPVAMAAAFSMAVIVGCGDAASDEDDKPGAKTQETKEADKPKDGPTGGQQPAQPEGLPPVPSK